MDDGGCLAVAIGVILALILVYLVVMGIGYVVVHYWPYLLIAGLIGGSGWYFRDSIAAWWRKMMIRRHYNHLMWLDDVEARRSTQMMHYITQAYDKGQNAKRSSARRGRPDGPRRVIRGEIDEGDE